MLAPCCARSATTNSMLLAYISQNGDGDINGIEFRACVRNSLAVKADNKEIDAFFGSMDKDGGGSLVSCCVIGRPPAGSLLELCGCSD